MFSYYPKPKFDLIIEPFAGAAWYSVLHRHNKVCLNEKYKVIYDIWNWLIKEATQDKILSHVDFFKGQNINDIDLHPSHKHLIGFCINRGSVNPKNIVQKWSCQSSLDPNWASTTNYQLKRIARLLPEIKHWELTCCDYRELPDVEATWFIDPPYQFGGEHYIVNDIDYNDLSNWCKDRKGQVIVCENTRANWMDFRPFHNITGQRSKTTESIWTNDEFKS